VIGGYSIFSIVLLLVAAASAGVAGYVLVSSIRIEGGIAGRLQDFTAEKKISAFDRYGTRFAARVNLPKQQTDSLGMALKWAQLGGHYMGWTIGGLLLRSIVFAAGGLLYVMFLRLAPIYYLVPIVAAAFPIVRVTSRADDVKKDVSRILPEMATVIAAEMDAGSNADKAISRASEIPGAVGKILRGAVSKSMESKLPMFSKGTVQGVMVDELSGWGDPSLIRFASQIDRVAGKGVEGPRIMAEIARGFAREYRSTVTRNAASLDNKLMFPLMLFFFAPFMIALMAPLIVELMAAL
jgi:tight adherence protein C